MVPKANGINLNNTYQATPMVSLDKGAKGPVND